MIHVGAKAIGLDEDAYRAMLAQLTGAESAKGLDAAGRRVVIEHLRGAGFNPKAGGKRAGAAGKKLVEDLRARAAGPAVGPQEAMIQGLWDQLNRLGAFRGGVHARLDTFMHRMGFPVAHPRFLEPAQASKVIEALKAWRARVRRERGLD